LLFFWLPAFVLLSAPVVSLTCTFGSLFGYQYTAPNGAITCPVRGSILVEFMPGKYFGPVRGGIMPSRCCYLPGVPGDTPGATYQASLTGRGVCEFRWLRHPRVTPGATHMASLTGRGVCEFRWLRHPRVTPGATYQASLTGRGVCEFRWLRHPRLHRGLPTWRP